MDYQFFRTDMGSGILFLEDDEAQMIIYRSLVKRYFPDIPSFFAERVSDAEDMLKRHRIKLAVVDLMIPVTNGADLIMRMKNDSIFKDIKVIVVTAAAKGTLLYTALDGIVEEFVTKPINHDRFVKMLQYHLGTARTN